MPDRSDRTQATLRQSLQGWLWVAPALLFLVVGGASLYGFVGVLCMLLGGNFLQYSVLLDDPVTARQVGIIAIELGVGMAVCGALLSIFHAFAAREPT